MRSTMCSSVRPRSKEADTRRDRDRDEPGWRTATACGRHRRKKARGARRDLNAARRPLRCWHQTAASESLVGGRSYADSQFNRAVRRTANFPGSAFRPVVLPDRDRERASPPTAWSRMSRFLQGKWTPKNDNGRYLGATTLRKALAQSINSVAVRLLARCRGSATSRRRPGGSARGVNVQIQMHHWRSGRRRSRCSIGGALCRLCQRRLCQRALHHPPHANGRRQGALYQRLEARSAPTIPARDVAAMNDMLRATLVSGTGRRAAAARS